MRIERLGDDKIRVLISAADLEERSIELHDLMHNGPRTQQLFWEMMEEARRSVGFAAGEGPLTVELAILPDSFVVIVTRTNGIPGQASREWKNPTGNPCEECPINPDDTDDLADDGENVDEDLLVYGFGDFERLVGACRTVRRHFSGASHLFRWRERFYLVLEVADLEDESFALIMGLLGEYGEEADFAAAFLGEHAIRIQSPDAMTVINEHFN